jgi:hypothetical protein
MSFVIFFTFLSIELTRSNVSGRELVELTLFDSSFYLYFFII